MINKKIFSAIAAVGAAGIGLLTTIVAPSQAATVTGRTSFLVAVQVPDALAGKYTSFKVDTWRKSEVGTDIKAPSGCFESVHWALGGGGLTMPYTTNLEVRWRGSEFNFDVDYYPSGNCTGTPTKIEHSDRAGMTNVTYGRKYIYAQPATCPADQVGAGNCLQP